MKAQAMKRALLLLGITAGACVHAQQAPAASCPPMSNVAQLSADGSVDVQQDVMRMTLSTSKQGSNANQVQKQLKQALDAALQLANAQAKPEALNVKTGNFNIYPSSNRNGQITAWQGSAELVLSGTDMARISAVADKIRTLTIANISFDMSKALRRKAEEQAQALAIADFRAKAQTIARSFGFSACGKLPSTPTVTATLGTATPGSLKCAPCLWQPTVKPAMLLWLPSPEKQRCMWW